MEVTGGSARTYVHPRVLDCVDQPQNLLIIQEGCLGVFRRFHYGLSVYRPEVLLSLAWRKRWDIKHMYGLR